jgi:hypothetical protein
MFGNFTKTGYIFQLWLNSNNNGHYTWITICVSLRMLCVNRLTLIGAKNASIKCCTDKWKHFMPLHIFYATSWKFAGSIPYEVTGFFNWPNPSSRTMALGSTQPLTKMSTRNPPVGKWRPALEADLNAICEPIVEKILEPRRLTTLWASTASYKNSCTFFFFGTFSLRLTVLRQLNNRKEHARTATHFTT